MARGEAGVEKAAKSPNAMSVGRSSGNPPILYLYEATNREKLKQERAWQIPKSEQGTRKTISPVMAMYLRITGGNLLDG